MWKRLIDCLIIYLYVNKVFMMYNPLLTHWNRVRVNPSPNPLTHINSWYWILNWPHVLLLNKNLYWLYVHLDYNLFLLSVGGEKKAVRQVVENLIGIISSTITCWASQYCFQYQQLSHSDPVTSGGRLIFPPCEVALIPDNCAPLAPYLLHCCLCDTMG